MSSGRKIMNSKHDEIFIKMGKKYICFGVCRNRKKSLKEHTDIDKTVALGRSIGRV